MPRDFRIFVSSVQKELKDERRAVKDFILHDPLLLRFFTDVFLFEDLPARDRQPDDVYLAEVEQRDIYLGIFGNKYGEWTNPEGRSPTEIEFDRATATHRERLIFVTREDDSLRDKEMAALIRKAGSQLTRRRFTDTPELIREVYASLVGFLERRGALRTTPFDAAACPGASPRDIDAKHITTFVETAEAEGRLTLRGKRTPQAILKHFNLLAGRQPTNAAMLLFGRDPSRFFGNAQVQCLHFHSTQKRKPIASQKTYEGTLFEMIDRAANFALDKISRRVGTRADSARAPVEHEVPHEAVAEAIVNAVAHRNYQHNGFVQVIVFADRIEVWNPGELPPGLTPALLRKPHGPIPRNPLIAEPLFRAHYIEKAGTGTTDMIADCRAAGLPEPDFEQRGPHFVVTLWRDWLTEEVLDGLGISDRQRKGLLCVKRAGRITNSEYQAAAGVTRKTATRDLDDMVEKGVFKRIGVKRGAHYVMAKKK